MDCRPEPSGNYAQPESDVRGDGKARDAGGSGDLGDGNGDVLASTGCRPEVHLHGGDLAARPVLHGKERNHQQLGRPGAVATRGGEAPRGGQTRRRNRRSRIPPRARRSEEHTSELQSRLHLVCRLLLEKKKSAMRFLPNCLKNTFLFSVATWRICPTLCHHHGASTCFLLVHARSWLYPCTAPTIAHSS